MKLLAIDPGPEESAYVLFEEKILDKGKKPNQGLFTLPIKADIVVIECPSSYGMAIGQTVMDTCIAVGAFWMLYQVLKIETHLIFRPTVKYHLCNSRRATKKNTTQALKDRFGPDNTKKNPNEFYHPESGKMNKDLWDALGVAVTWIEPKDYEFLKDEQKLSSWLKSKNI